jgi:hypothetical protein
MARMVLAYAIPPGLLHKINKFFSDPTLGPQLVATLSSVGIDHQGWYVQATEADGGVFISVWEGQDPQGSLNKFVSCEDPLACVLRDHFKVCSGSDLGQSVPPVSLKLPFGTATALFEC